MAKFGELDPGSHSTAVTPLEGRLGGFHFCLESSLKLLSHQEVFGVGLKNECPGRVCEKKRFCGEKTKEF